MRAVLCTAILTMLAASGLQAQEAAKNAQKQAPPAAQAPATADPSYKIGPQDVLRIDVWKETEISRSVPVRPDGKISLPLLNDVQAAGLTAMELASVITEGLKKFINSPQVTVTVAEINSRRIYVTGEVARPGAYPLLPAMTALQALTSGGGFTQFSNTKKIYVLRNESGKQVKHPFNYKLVLDGKQDDIPLQPGDTIVVP